MKTLYTLLICFLFVGVTNSQERYITKNGTVTFFSSSPMEDITADNNQVLSIIDTSTGKMAISILMKSFMFEKALMQEHFNENYIESDKFPKATFRGEIINFLNLKESDKTVEIKGTITIHGKSKEITITSNITKTAESIILKGDFGVKVADFGIKIPGVVAKNIAKEIKVSFELNHKPYKKK
jgi:polyisoprenoid-binding protein YceI